MSCAPTVLIVDHQAERGKTFEAWLTPYARCLMLQAADDLAETLIRDRIDLVLIADHYPGIDLRQLTQHHVDGRNDPFEPFAVVVCAGLDREAQLLDLGAADVIHDQPEQAVVVARIRQQLRLAALESALREMTDVDVVTGLPTEHRFRAHLKQAWYRALRRGDSVSLVLAETPDELPIDQQRELGALLQRAAQRVTDIAFRRSAKGFGCMLPETEASGVQWVAERILENFLNRSPNAKMARLSLGVSTLTPHLWGSPDDLIVQADERLQMAQRAGGNLVGLNEGVIAPVASALPGASQAQTTQRTALRPLRLRDVDTPSPAELSNQQP